MHKTATGIKITIQDKVHVSIHQNKCNYQYIKTIANNKNSVHPTSEILLVSKQGFNRISGSIKMPAVPDRDGLSLDKGTF